MSVSKEAKTIFCSLLELDSEVQRRAMLDQSCGSNCALRKEVEDLLAAYARGARFDPARRPRQGTPKVVFEQPGTRLGPYTLERLIGEGGMGVVYLAEQRQPVVREVALKIIKPGMDTNRVIQRFEAERQALAVMDHPHVAKVFDAGATESGRPYFVMEYVDGIPCNDYCDQRRLTLRQRVEVFLKVCHGVHHAHQKGIIHRDLKPANILVAEYDNQATPKIIDFGVAKATDPSITGPTLHTLDGQILGTLEYMSPEQARLDQVDVDTRSDIYSLGVVLYELLTGTTPIRRERIESVSVTEMLRIVCDEDPVLPSARAADLGSGAERIADARRLRPGDLPRRLAQELDWIVMRALEKDRNRRYESAGALAQDLERFLRDEAVLACPPSRGYRFRKFVCRNRGPVVAASMMGLLLILGLTGTSIGFFHARSSEDAQRKQSFGLALDRGLALCAEGKVGTGMLWLTRALELCPQDEPAYENLVRANLQAWRAELSSLRMMYPHQDAVISVAISPDGKRLATGSNDNTARLWGLESGERMGAPLRHRGDVHELEFSADQTRLLSSDYRTTAFIWDAATGRRLRTFHHGEHDGHDPSQTPCAASCGAAQASAKCGGVAGAAFRPGANHQFVTSCGDGTVTVWHAERGLRLFTFEKEHKAFVHDVAFSPDGHRMLTACHDKKTRIWDVQSRKVIATIQHRTRVPTADFLGDAGDRVVTGDGDGNIFIWSVAEALRRKDHRLSEADGDYLLGPLHHNGVIHRIRADESGKRFLSASYDNTASLWILGEDGIVRRQIEQRAAVQGAVFQPGGSHLAIGCDDNAARLLRPAAGQVVASTQHPYHRSQEAVYTMDGRYVLTRGKDDRVRVAETLGNRRFPPMDHPDQVISLTVARDGSFVVIGTTKNACQIFDTTTGLPRSAPLQHESGVWALALSPDGTRLLSGSYAGSVQVRDTADGRLLGQPMQQVARIHGLAFDPKGARFAVASADKLVRIFRCDSWEQPLVLRGHRSAAVAVAFSPDGRRVATAGHDCTLRIWDGASGAPVSKPMRLDGPIWYGTNVSFSPDGKLVVTGSDNRMVRVWDVATAQPLGPPLRHGAGVRMVAFAVDGRVLSGTTTARVNAWSLNCAPMSGAVGHIRLWVEVQTGLTLDDGGTVQPLDTENWKQRWAELSRDVH